jgi:hypothetical protein
LSIFLIKTQTGGNKMKLKIKETGEIQEISERQFIEAFTHAGRKDNFSYNGLSALYEYAEDVNQEYMLDVIKLCGNFCEYDNLSDYLEVYPEDKFENIDEISTKTTLIKHDTGFIIESY